MNKPNITYIGDCPNPGDFERVNYNLARAIKAQKNYYKWKIRKVEYLQTKCKRIINKSRQ